MRPRQIILLGATGSIGQSTLEVIRANPQHLRLLGIAANRNAAKLAHIAREFSVPHAVLFDPVACREARKQSLFPRTTRLAAGMDALNELATLPDADIVTSAIVGTTGLRPTLAAIEAGKDIALASKEILVLAGKFVTAAARKHNVRLLPVDSEHNAIFQCLQGHPQEHLDHIILTASGGPFRLTPTEAMASITPRQACQHPNWEMGTKITIDSATMANKGLEMIEARWLFNLDPDLIKVVVHPQSIVHSMVQLIDGSILAHLSPPSMTFAIQHCLLHPRRTAGVVPTLDFSQLLQLEFFPPDTRRFPMLRLARNAMEIAGTATAIFNAANEIAVAAFLAETIKFTDIPRFVEKTLEKITPTEPNSLHDVLLAEEEARQTTRQLIANSPQ